MPDEAVDQPPQGVIMFDSAGAEVVVEGACSALPRSDGNLYEPISWLQHNPTNHSDKDVEHPLKHSLRCALTFSC
jgi:hypothetical protein